MEPMDLKLWRVARDLTQRQAAELVGRHVNTWQLWERGKYPIPHWVPLKLREVRDG